MTYSNMDQSTFEEYVELNHPSYLMVSVIEPNHPQFIFSWIMNQSNAMPVDAQFDQAGNPLVIIYKLLY